MITNMYYVYFRGTRNGEYITAENLLSAKWLFARKHNLTSIAYIAGPNCDKCIRDVATAYAKLVAKDLMTEVK